jgi:hypothetical protein
LSIDDRSVKNASWTAIPSAAVGTVRSRILRTQPGGDRRSTACACAGEYRTVAESTTTSTKSSSGAGGVGGSVRGVTAIAAESASSRQNSATSTRVSAGSCSAADSAIGSAIAR